MSLAATIRAEFAGPLARLPVAIVAIDAAGCLLGANRRFHELCDTTRLPTLAEITEPAGRAAWSACAAAVMTGGKSIDFTQPLLRKGAPPICVKVSMSAVLRDDGEADHVLASINDIDEHERSAEAQRTKMEDATEELRSRSEFVAVVAHEFKNGLTGIAGFAEMIRDFELEPDTVKEYAGDILNDAHRMSRMLSEMLDLARLESGQMRLQVVEADLNALIEPQVRHLAVACARVVFAPGNLPPVACDPDRTIQVIANLLSNALKYSPNGGEIKVESRLNGGVAEVSFRDQGLGIPAEEVGRLFERFHRVEKGDAGKISGTGLGLAVSREIVQRQGGRLSVESVFGEGSTFTFTVPIAQPGSPQATEPETGKEA